MENNTMTTKETAGEDMRLLHESVKAGDVEGVRALLERGVDPDARSEKIDFVEATPLMHAVASGHEEMASLLIAYGASVTAADYWGETVGNYALSPKDARPMLELLLAHGLPVNAQDEDGMTLLMVAMGGHELSVVHFLLEHGADIHLADVNGWTALMHAIDFYDDETARLLLSLGADVNARDFRGQTPLMLAVCMYEDDLLDLRNPQAALRGYTEDYSELDADVADTMRLLLEYGADVHAQDNKGWTALLLALACGYEQAARLLAEQGAGLADVAPEVVARARLFAEHNRCHEAVALLDELARA